MRVLTSASFRTALLAVAAILLGIGATKSGTPVPPSAGVLTPARLDGFRRLPGDLGALPLVPPFPVTPMRAAKIGLGRDLFFETRLSVDRTMSCATCHDPRHGFADGKVLSPGFGGKTLRRHSPTVLNAAYTVAQFWDGRASGIEAQAIMPIMSNDEMNMGSEAIVVERLEQEPKYAQAFRQLYGAPPNLKLIGDAIAAFEQTLVTPDSPFDRYARGDRSALSEQQKRGLILFVGKAACSQCHLGPNFTDGVFHDLGAAPLSGAPPDAGRFEVTKNPADRGAFKTPTLRNVSLTAPYLHDGSMATLRQVVDFYNKGGGPDAGKSDRLFELGLTAAEIEDLISFLESLTGTLPKVAEIR
jgi:cytochrome c peroxidase